MFNIQIHTIMKSNTFFLGLIAILSLGTLYFSHTNSKQIQALRQENENLYARIDSALKSREIPTQPTTTEAAPEPKNAVTAFFDYLINLGEDDDTTPKNTKNKQKIVVASKYRIEDRYVRYDIEKPELKGDEVGNVVISILVNCSGDVNSAKLKSATGITNEEVIEACKKAALKTKFNYDPNHDYDKKQPGTITYTFSAK